MERGLLSCCRVHLSPGSPGPTLPNSSNLCSIIPPPSPPGVVLPGRYLELNRVHRTMATRLLPGPTGSSPGHQTRPTTLDPHTWNHTDYTWTTGFNLSCMDRSQLP
ncbi:hypothetical protein CW304_30880 [Bacillus sp. UFRGS-B20]|nr:hypothetical protein CW304_30880 [Bacillus sp. UFRGS-B20]